MTFELDDFDLSNNGDIIDNGYSNNKKITYTPNGHSQNARQVKEAQHKIEVGLYEDISNEQYHSGPGISSSSLKPAIKSMHRYYETSIGNIPFVETEAMKLGTAVHKLTLEALDFSTDIVISPKFGRKAIDQEAKEQFYAENKGKTIINTDQYDDCRRMRDSIMKLPDVEYIFSTGKPELSGYYQDIAPARNESTYMLCKYRPDWRTDWCIADIKSTRDASKEAFSRTINDLNYHVSAAHYLEGDRILKGTDHRQFIFICVEPDYPYEACLYRLGQESLELGELIRRNILAQIKEGRTNNNWPILNNGIASEIEVPNYALNELRLSRI